MTAVSTRDVSRSAAASDMAVLSATIVSCAIRGRRARSARPPLAVLETPPDTPGRGIGYRASSRPGLVERLAIQLPPCPSGGRASGRLSLHRTEASRIRLLAPP